MGHMALVDLSAGHELARYSLNFFEGVEIAIHLLDVHLERPILLQLVAFVDSDQRTFANKTVVSNSRCSILAECMRFGGQS